MMKQITYVLVTLLALHITSCRHDDGRPCESAGTSRNVAVQFDTGDVLRRLATDGYADAVEQAVLATWHAVSYRCPDNYVEIFAANFKDIEPSARFADVFAGFDTGRADSIAALRGMISAYVTDACGDILKARLAVCGAAHVDVHAHGDNPSRVVVSFDGGVDSAVVSGVLSMQGRMYATRIFKAGTLDASFSRLAPVLDIVDGGADFVAMRAGRQALTGSEPYVGRVDNPAAVEAISAMFMSPEGMAPMPGSFRLVWGKRLGGEYKAYALSLEGGESEISLTGKVARADVAGEPGARHLEVALLHDAAARWRQVTSDATGGALAVVIDDSVVMAPSVNAPIRSGCLTVEGDYGDAYYTMLSAVLPNPLPVRVVR